MQGVYYTSHLIYMVYTILLASYTGCIQHFSHHIQGVYNSFCSLYRVYKTSINYIQGVFDSSKFSPHIQGVYTILLTSHTGCYTSSHLIYWVYATVLTSYKGVYNTSHLKYRMYTTLLPLNTACIQHLSPHTQVVYKISHVIYRVYVTVLSSHLIYIYKNSYLFTGCI
jgi:hypothetical protein